jgi:hypothetical protein
MTNLKFIISDNTYLSISSAERLFNRETFNSIVNLTLIESDYNIDIGGYFTLYEIISEFESAIVECLSGIRKLKNNIDETYSLIKDLNIETYKYYHTEDLKYLETTDELLKKILFNGDYYIGFYNLKDTCIIEVGQKYLNFDDYVGDVLTKDFTKWIDKLEIKKYQINKNNINEWKKKIENIVISKTL